MVGWCVLRPIVVGAHGGVSKKMINKKKSENHNQLPSIFCFGECFLVVAVEICAVQNRSEMTDSWPRFGAKCSLASVCVRVQRAHDIYFAP